MIQIISCKVTEESRATLGCGRRYDRTLGEVVTHIGGVNLALEVVRSGCSGLKWFGMVELVVVK